MTVSSLKYFFTLSHKCNRQNSQTPHPQLKSTQQVRRHVWSEQETSYLTILLCSHWSTHPVSSSHWMRVMPRPVAFLKVYLRMIFAHNSGSHTHCSQLPCPVTQTPLPCSIPGRPVIITATHERGTYIRHHTWVGRVMVTLPQIRLRDILCWSSSFHNHDDTVVLLHEAIKTLYNLPLQAPGTDTDSAKL